MKSTKTAMLEQMCASFGYMSLKYVTQDCKGEMTTVQLV